MSYPVAHHVYAAYNNFASVAGLLVGAVFVQFTNWRWVYRCVAIMAIPASLVGVAFIPKRVSTRKSGGTAMERFKTLDIVGVSLVTLAIILFIFAITSGSSTGWASASVLAPLIISIGLFVSFFYWEKVTHHEKAAM